MNILFIFSRHSENPKDSTLTKDLSDEFSKHGHKVFVATLLEKKENRKTQLKVENGYEVLRIKTGNYFDSPGKLEKGITALTMPYFLKNGIKKNIGNEKIDLIYSHTPFVSNPKLIKSLKKYFKCPAMLHLWDIFPQNAVDLGMMKNPFLIKYFEKVEQEMYSSFDYIGCMSRGNLEFMKFQDKSFRNCKYFILKNWAEIKPEIVVEKDIIRRKYGYTKEDFICVFGGNLGKPQKLENLLKLAEKALENPSIKFLFIGKGTEQERLKEIADRLKLFNVNFLYYIPRENYEELVSACDVGLVSLDEKFTVPNFPSKTTDYFKVKIPVLASLDRAAAKDYGDFLEKEIQAGIYSLAGDEESLYDKLKYLFNNPKERERFGKNGRKYYEENLGVDRAYETIMGQLNK